MAVQERSYFSVVLPWLICGLAALFYCYEYLLRVSPSVMIPELMRSFSVSATEIGLLTSLYYYAYTPMQLPVGLMMDRFGPRRILTFAVLCCAIGTFMFGGMNGLWIAGIGRFLVGLGSAFAFVGVLKLATVWLPPNRFGMISGLATTLGMLGAISGEMILGHFVSEVGWEKTIAYSGYFGLLLLPVVWFVIRDNRPDQPTAVMRYPGMGNLSRDLFRVFHNKQVWLAGLVGGAMFLPTSVFAELWGIECLKVVHNLSKSEATHATSLVFLGWAFGGPLMGLFSDRIESRRFPLAIGCFSAAVFLSVLLWVPGLSYNAVRALCFFFGVVSGAQVINFAVARENMPLSLAGTTLATTNFIIMMGGMICQPLVGKVLDLTWGGAFQDDVPLYTIGGYQLALTMLPVCLFLGVFLIGLMKETGGRLHSD
ncbi:MAG: MFS transporter [Pseudomonadota bacterium]